MCRGSVRIVLPGSCSHVEKSYVLFNILHSQACGRINKPNLEEAAYFARRTIDTRNQDIRLFLLIQISLLDEWLTAIQILSGRSEQRTHTP